MINRTILVGRLTKDLELRKTPNGASVVQFTLAVNRRIKTQGQPDADFINCVAWNKTADTMAQYLHKGAQIGVEGRIQVRNYDNKEGKKVYVTEVIVDTFTFLDTKSENTQPTQANYSTNTSPYDENDHLDIASDDLPF